MNELPEKGTRAVYHACAREEARGTVVATYRDNEGAWAVLRMDEPKRDYVKNPDTDDLEHVVTPDIRVVKLNDDDESWSGWLNTGWNQLDKYWVLEMKEGSGFASYSKENLEKAKELLETAAQRIFDEYFDEGFAGSDLSFHIVEREDPV